jgi:hypothetical protein
MCGLAYRGTVSSIEYIVRKGKEMQGEIQEIQKQSSGLPVGQSASQENTGNKLLTPTLILPPQGGGNYGNDRWDTCPTLTFSFLPEFEEEGNKDAYKETKHSGD